jgi:hypothetical protein
MTAANILIYVALIGYVVFKKVQGQPLKTPKGLFALPVILVIIGYGDLAHGTGPKPIEITLIVIGALLSLALGALRGRTDKLSTRDGSPFMQWGATSLALFIGNLAAKLVLDLIAIAAGSTASAAGKSLIFTLGLTLLGEALVLFVRSGGATDLIGQSRATTAPPRRATTDRAPRRQMGQPAEIPAIATPSLRRVAEAVERHHSHHRARHHDRQRHDRQRHDRETL